MYGVFRRPPHRVTGQSWLPTAATAGTAHTVTPADTLALADATTKAVGQARADSVALADAVTKAVGQSRADTVALTDSFSRAMTLARTLADSVALADALTSAKTIPLSISDSVVLADALVKALSKVVSDTVALSDAITPVAGKGASIADTVALSDARAHSRGVAFGNNVLPNPGLEVAATDWVASGVGASIARDTGVAHSGVASLHIQGDGTGASQGTATWSIDLGHSLAGERWTVGVWVFDNLGGTPITLSINGRNSAGSLVQSATLDFIGTGGWQYVAVSTTFTNASVRRVGPKVSRTGTGTIDVHVDDATTYGETVAVTDAFARVAEYLRATADQVALVDSFTRVLVAERIIVDAVAITDTLSAVLGKTVSVADAIALSDSLTAVLNVEPTQFAMGGMPLLASAVTGYIDPAADGRIQFPEPVGIA